MGRRKTDDVSRVGPKLWARFLRRHFSCASVEPLNAQLLFPAMPYETFEFGVFPEPLPKRAAPKVFERTHDLGRNPDGAYTAELSSPDIKFNLYERVTQRVPESKYWLLKEISPFLRDQPPPIDTTANLAAALLTDLGLMVLERGAIAAWEKLNPNGLIQAERSTIDALFRSARLPEYLALALSLTHLAVWNEPPSPQPNLSQRLLQFCQAAATNFGLSITREGLQLDSCDYSILQIGIEQGRQAIGHLGSRSMSARLDIKPPSLQQRLVLVPISPTTQKAIQCLTEAMHLQLDTFHLWQDNWEQFSKSLKAARANPPKADPAGAARALEEAAATVPAALAARSRLNLQRYRPAQLKRHARLSQPG